MNASEIFRSDRRRDMFLASYPRSGNTWLRTFLFHARIGRGPENLAEIDRGVPDEHHRIELANLLHAKHPTERLIVKTHEPNRIRAPYQDVAYIVRDPRNVIPSYYRYRNRGGATADGDIEEFAAGCVAGCVWPCSWFEHVSSWLAFRRRYPERISVIRYEALAARDSSEIQRLGKALHIPEDANWEELFTYYDIARMRELEEQGNRPNEPAEGFIGKGQASAAQWEIVDAEIRRHAPHWLDLMQDLDYAT
jgi:hypothetical protein